MRNTVIGIVVGLVAGVVVGSTVVAPRLRLDSDAAALGQAAKTAATPSVTVGLAPPPGGAAEVHLKMASAYSSALPQLGTLAKRLESEIWRVSGGAVEIRFHEPGTLVPPPEMFEAVGSGAIDAAFSPSRFWANRIPSLQLFASVPFGPTPEEYLAWIYFGGGRELSREIYRRHNIHGIYCGLIASEASGWFRKEIRTLDDLKGLRMRFDGLGAKVMEKLGVETQSLEEGSIFVALENGAIDAAEFSMPAIDLQLGFHRMVRHYYFPGWHQPSTLFTLMINLDRWRALPATARAQIEAVCGDNIRYGLAEGEALQFAALRDLTAQGVEIHRWPAVILDALEAAWRQVAEEEADDDDDFKRVWQSLSAFREDYSMWKELGRE